MSVGSFLNRYIFGGEVSAPQGPVTTPPPSTKNLVAMPDGSFYSPDNGQTYHRTPDGSFASTATPNVAQQVGANASRAAGFYGQVPGYDAREAEAYGREASLADTLNAVAHGQGPTVAGTQLAIGQDQAARQQLAQAAGASGNNAALARMNAMGNTAQLQAQTNQAASLARAQEEANALNQLAGVTSAMTNQSQAAAGQKINAGNAVNTLAMQGETAREGLTEKANEADAQNNTGVMDKLFNGAGQALSFLAL
jgi:hypothetical protein